jgi:hypothetical protein
MSDPLYIFPKGTDPLESVVRIDATLDEKRIAKYSTTKRPVEDIGKFSDYVDKEPKQHSFTGLLTATPILGAFGRDRVKKILDALEKMADDRKVVTAVFGWWVFDAAVTNVEQTTSLEEGDAIRLSVSFEEVRQTTPQTTSIPASRLKPKQKRRKGKSTGPNKQSGKAASPRGSRAWKRIYGK